MSARAEPAERHRADAARFAREREAHEATGNRLGIARLLAFLGAVVLGIGGMVQGNLPSAWAGLASLAAFVALVAVHARVVARRDLAEVRRDVANASLARVTDAWQTLPSQGGGLLPGDHPYAADVDLVGPGSLFQRIDVTHTVPGERTLAAWLGAPADLETIRARQAAVAELAEAHELRRELEVAALVAAGDRKLDPAPFLAFTRAPAFVRGKAWLVAASIVLPLALVGAAILGQVGLVPDAAWVVPFVGTAALGLATAGRTREAFDRAAAKQRFGEAFARMLRVVEGARFEAPALVALRRRLDAGGTNPSRAFARLDTWLGFAALREQPLVQIPLQMTLLYDLHVLYGLERWNASVGAAMPELFAALGELEALASLATLADGDPAATRPEVVDAADGLSFEALSHPLLPAGGRVPNDVALAGPGAALVVTGSNMAGKSTLLRAVALNLALGLAGGPVCARRARLPLVRLRASMRADDDLQHGASYFHAELTKLRRVVAEAEAQPPIFFVLDELLRGTNARARHLGARAVLEHLLDRGAMGLVATHDAALGTMEHERPGRVRNVHFTDVMRGDQMVFDYRLRDGVVRTSNALRLLRLAGIDVPDDDGVDVAPPPGPPAAG